jgi:RNA polymerase sigma factor (sigma-70 family)
MNDQSLLLVQYRQALQRFAWRIQYRTRKQTNREILSIDFDHFKNTHNDFSDLLSNIQAEELIQTINSEKGRHIIKRIYIDGLKEKEVADELRISQQAVSKWKKKSLERMRQQLF